MTSARRPLRLVHVSPFLDPRTGGGMARASTALCRALAARGHEVTLIGPASADLPPGVQEVDGVRVQRRAAILSRALFPWCPGLSAVVRDAMARADLLHVHGHRTAVALAGARGARGAGRPYVLQPHGTWPLHGQKLLAKRVFDRLAGEALVRGAAALLAVSAEEATDLPRPARVVRNGVDPVGRADGPRGGGGLLFVGGGATQKRAQALSGLLDRVAAALTVVGPGEPAVRAVLGRHADRATFRGSLDGDALAAAYRSADVLVHPAVGEAFGLVPLEAALAGTASVVAGGHGAGALFAEAGGCVVDPDDPEALAGAVRLRLQEPARAHAEADRVAAFVRDHCDWDRAARSMEDVYAGVCEAVAVRTAS